MSYEGSYFTVESPQLTELSLWEVGCDGDSHVATFTGSRAEYNANEYVMMKNHTYFLICMTIFKFFTGQCSDDAYMIFSSILGIFLGLMFVCFV